MNEISNIRYVITGYFRTLWKSLIGKVNIRFDELYEIIDWQMEQIEALEAKLEAAKKPVKKAGPGLKKKASSEVKVPKGFTGRPD